MEGRCEAYEVQTRKLTETVERLKKDKRRLDELVTLKEG